MGYGLTLHEVKSGKCGFPLGKTPLPDLNTVYSIIPWA